jgi:predicted RNA-binding Zn ribbon-like protein
MADQGREHYLLREDVALDFVNTVEWHAAETPVERLNDFRDFVTWARQAGVVGETDAARLSCWAEEHPSRASKLLAQVIELREALYRILVTTTSGLRPASSDVERVNEALRDSCSHAVLQPAERGLSWGWDEVECSPERPLWLVARSAGELLTSPTLARVKQCADDLCGWFFMDASRNQSRRWCEMGDCGNRAKARRHYARVKQKRDALGG